MQIEHFLTHNVITFPERSSPPHCILPFFAQKLSSGNYLICEKSSIVEVTPDGNVVWEFGRFGVRNGSGIISDAYHAWEYTERGTVLIADMRGEVLEIDKKTHNIVRHLKGLAAPSCAVIDPATDTIIVAESEANVITERDSDGKILWQFGEKDTAGTDDVHLNHPMGVDLARSSFYPNVTSTKAFDHLLISDYANHRVLLVDRKTGKIKRRTLSTFPEKVFYTPESGIAVTGYVLGYTADQDWHIRWYAPDNWMIVPTFSGTLLLIDAVTLMEVDFKRSPVSRLPGSYRMLDKYPLKGNSSVGPIESDADSKDIPPIPVFGLHRGFTLYAQSSASASLDILVAKTKGKYGPTVVFDEWVVFEEDIDVKPGKLTYCKVDESMSFVSAVVRMKDNEGRVDMWISYD